MTQYCHMCRNREEAINTRPRSQLYAGVIVLTFKLPVTRPQTAPYDSLNALLNNIVDGEESTKDESTKDESTFTSWSPCLTDPRQAVIVTTVQGVCDNAESAVFNDIRDYLAVPPRIRHAYLDMAALSLAAISPNQRIACEIQQLRTSEPEVANAIAKAFGWDIKSSPLSAKIEGSASATFGQPGDLVRDHWAWAEVDHNRPRPTSMSTTVALSCSSQLSLDSFEATQNVYPPAKIYRRYIEDLAEETLLMIYQWNSYADGDRFKDISRKSYGLNGEEVSSDLWERDVNRPVKYLQSLGATLETYKLELRAVEPRIQSKSQEQDMDPEIFPRRKRVRSRALSELVSDFGGKVGRLLK